MRSTRRHTRARQTNPLPPASSLTAPRLAHGMPPRDGGSAMPNVLMVFPRFNQNWFWNLQAVCDTYGSRAQSPPLGLMTVAALLPPEWNVRLVDRNAHTLQESDLAWAHMVMTGGMLPQRADAFTVIDLAHHHGKPVVVGGPDPMSSPEEYEDADFRVLGE